MTDIHPFVLQRLDGLMTIKDKLSFGTQAALDYVKQRLIEHHPMLCQPHSLKDKFNYWFANIDRNYWKPFRFTNYDPIEVMLAIQFYRALLVKNEKFLSNTSEGDPMPGLDEANMLYNLFDINSD